MSRGINHIWLSGNVSGTPVYGTTHSGSECCSFVLVCDRPGSGGVTVKCFVNVNVYAGLVDICRKKLAKGVYVQVVGELMDREDGRGSDARAKEIVF
jgi:single-stranded DNA-binding protein